MSRIWSIACADCKESIDVGQGWCREITDAPTEGTLWSGMPETMTNLWLFLQKHRQHAFGQESPQQHNLKFVDEEGELIWDCTEFVGTPNALLAAKSEEK